MRLLANLALLFLCLASLRAEFTKEWEALWDSGVYDRLSYFVVDRENNIYIGGSTRTNQNIEPIAASAVKISTEGKVLWASTVYPAESPPVQDVSLDDSGNFFLAAVLWTPAGRSPSLIKFDSLGTELWRKSFASSWDIAPAQDGNLIISGESIKMISPSGSVLWTQTKSLGKVTPDLQGNIIVWGSSFGLQKLDPSGQIIWSKTNFPVSALQVSPSGSIFAGTTSIANYCCSNSWITMKLNSDGDVIWRKVDEATPMIHHSETYDELSALAIDAEENVYVTGLMKHHASRDPTFPILKYDKDGQLLWRTTTAVFDSGIGAKPRQLLIDSNRNLFLLLPYYKDTIQGITVLKCDSSGLLSAKLEIPTPTNPTRGWIQLDNEDKLLVGTTTTNFDLWLAKYSHELGPAAPRVIAQPRSQALLPGQAFRATVSLDHENDVTFQWLWQGLEIPGATNSTFLIPTVTREDRGYYSVRVTYPGGFLSTADAFLDVLPGPLVLEDMQFTATFDPLKPNYLIISFQSELAHEYTLWKSSDFRSWSGQSISPTGETTTLSIPFPSTPFAYFTLVKHKLPRRP